MHNNDKIDESAGDAQQPKMITFYIKLMGKLLLISCVSHIPVLISCVPHIPVLISWVPHIPVLISLVPHIPVLIAMCLIYLC